MNTARISAFDSLFLLGESRQIMMHVAGMMIFELPEGASPDYLRQLGQRMKDSAALFPPWNRRPTMPDALWNPRNRWKEEADVDMDYHVRRLALPAPGDERELGVLISRLHSNPLDFSRPLWEVYVIEGLERNRFAIYTKVHHALMDGYTAVRSMSRALASTPEEPARPFFFSEPPERRPTPNYPAIKFNIGRMSKAPVEQVQSTYHAASALARFWRRDRSEANKDLVSSWEAPMTILNQRIGRNRRYATQQIALADAKVLAKKNGGTLNDVAI